jgi:hypothetical protein
LVAFSIFALGLGVGLVRAVLFPNTRRKYVLVFLVPSSVHYLGYGRIVVVSLKVMVGEA